MRLLRHGTETQTAGRTITEGWKDACEALGYEFYLWDKTKESPDQVFEKFRPTHYIGDCRDRFEIPDYVKKRKCKILCGVDQFPRSGKSPIFPTLAQEGYIADAAMIEWVKKLQPDAVYHQATMDVIEDGWGGWNELGFSLFSIPLAGNSIKFYQDPVVEFSQRQFDVVYVGGFWPYKSIGMYSYLFPCFTYTQKCVVVGPGWPIQVSAEFIDSHGVRNLWSQAKVAPSISEPHTRFNVTGARGGELPERVYNSLLCGAYMVSDNVASEKLLGIKSFQNPDEYHYQIKRAIDPNNSVTIALEIAAMRAKVVEGHTYMSRVKSLNSF